MTEFPLVVFAASVLGSLHCAGMCGPLAWIAASGGTANRGGRLPALVGFHGARLLLYASLGLAAGSFGYVLDLGGAASGIQRLAAWIGGLGMIGYAVMRLVGGSQWLRGSMVARWTSPLASWTAKANAIRGWRRAALIGIFSSLMPCGWLYAFVLAATGTGSPLAGVLLMIAFWMGSLPILLLVVSGMGRLSQPLMARVPAILAIVVLLIGVASIAGRGTIDLSNQRAFVSRGMTTDAIHSIRQEDLPCCRGLIEGE